MNLEFFNITKVQLNKDFSDIINSFAKKFGGFDLGIEKLGEYMGFSYLVEKNDVRDYDGVPFEMVLPFATGSDGEHMGWMNLAPNRLDFKMPFVTWTPMGGNVFFIGTEVEEIIANQIRYLHEENEFENIDINFLKTINIDPLKGSQNQLFINFEKELKPLPIDINEGLHFEMTFDGTGVLAQENLFERKYERDESLSLSDRLKAGNAKLKSFPATALLITKDVYYDIWQEGVSYELLKPTLSLLKECYSRLRMEFAVTLVQEEISNADNN